MKHLTVFFAAFAFTLCAACSPSPAKDSTADTSSTVMSETTKDSTPQTSTSTQTQTEGVSNETVASQQETTANASGTLYIGSSGSFQEFPFTGEKTPDNLVAAIASLTGWNLTLADPITDGKGGMTVCFTKDSSIFTGPPTQQNEDFFAYDNISLAQMIMDSIQKTLQENYVDRASGGDPSSLDIYFCVMENGNITDIAFPEDHALVPMDSPYQGIAIE